MLTSKAKLLQDNNEAQGGSGELNLLSTESHTGQHSQDALLPKTLQQEIKILYLISI